MKNLLAVVAISLSLIACGGGNGDANSSNGTEVSAPDSLKRASDSVMQTGDTSALNMPMGDSTSSSGSHGQGSGSNAGGGKTGESKDKKGK